MFALDTNTLVHFVKGVGRVGEHLGRIHQSELAIPAVVLYEIEVGMRRIGNPQRRRELLQPFLDAAEIWPLDSGSAVAAAEIRHALERQGSGIGPVDTLIAGIVLSRGGTLVTHNTAEFSRVPGLSLVDWF